MTERRTKAHLLEKVKNRLNVLSSLTPDVSHWAEFDRVEWRD